MAVAVRKYRLANPQRSRATKKKRRANPTSLVTLGFLNPERSTVKRKTKIRRRNPAATVARRRNSSTKRRRRNPAAPVHRRRTVKVRRRRNPAMVDRTTDLMKQGAAALVGLVITRQGPQFALGAKNTGVLGYVATVIAALAASFAIRKAAGPAAGHAALIGGGMQFASRLLNEYVSPIGKMLSLSGVGDAHAAGLGEIRQSYFPLPVPTRPGTLEPLQLNAAAPTPSVTQANAPAPAATQMAGIHTRSRFASRY